MSRFLLFLFALLIVCTDLSFSAAPAPSPVSDINSPPSPAPGSPADSPNPSSPPSPASTTQSPSSSPAPSPTSAPPSDLSTRPAPSPFTPTPAPSEPADINHESSDSRAEESKKSEGMSGGTKAGIVIGVFVGAGLVGLGGFVYKKRQENQRKTQYGLEMRGSFI